MTAQNPVGGEKPKSNRNGVYLGILLVAFIGALVEMQRRFHIFTES